MSSPLGGVLKIIAAAVIAWAWLNGTLQRVVEQATTAFAPAGSATGGSFAGGGSGSSSGGSGSGPGGTGSTPRPGGIGFI